MRVTLNQDELFGAIEAYLIDKLNLDNTASIEISLTAGRSPKGYTADVDITYPKSTSPFADKITARTVEDVEGGQDTHDEPNQASSPNVDVAKSPVPDNLFSN